MVKKIYSKCLDSKNFYSRALTGENLYSENLSILKINKFINIKNVYMAKIVHNKHFYNIFGDIANFYSI